MTDLGLAAWLTLGVLLFGGGFLAAILGGRERGLRVAVPAMLGSAVIIALALTRHQVLGGAGSNLALMIVLGGGLMLLVADGQEAS